MKYGEKQKERKREREINGKNEKIKKLSTCERSRTLIMGMCEVGER